MAAQRGPGGEIHLPRPRDPDADVAVPVRGDRPAGDHPLSDISDLTGQVLVHDLPPRLPWPAVHAPLAATGRVWAKVSRQPAVGEPARAAARITSVITGMHAIVFSPQAEKVRAFFADVLGMPSVDAGGGWPIFALPPAELAVHPADGATHHELYLMCDDIDATLAELRGKGAEVAREASDQGWGLVAAIRLPDGSELPIYQPRHPSPIRP